MTTANETVAELNIVLEIFLFLSVIFIAAGHMSKNVLY